MLYVKPDARGLISYCSCRCVVICTVSYGNVYLATPSLRLPFVGKCCMWREIQVQIWEYLYRVGAWYRLKVAHESCKHMHASYSAHTRTLYSTHAIPIVYIHFSAHLILSAPQIEPRIVATSICARHINWNNQGNSRALKMVYIVVVFIINFRP